MVRLWLCLYNLNNVKITSVRARGVWGIFTKQLMNIIKCFSVRPGANVMKLFMAVFYNIIQSFFGWGCLNAEGGLSIKHYRLVILLCLLYCQSQEHKLEQTH